jgi:hypothetical protein
VTAKQHDEHSLPEPLPLGQSLQARFLSQVRRLPAATQVLLLAADADPTGDPTLLWRAGPHLGFGINAASPAEVAEMVTIGQTMAFRHLLVRSAIYHGATIADRWRVHQALAEATDPGSAVQPARPAHRTGAAAGSTQPVVGVPGAASDFSGAVFVHHYHQRRRPPGAPNPDCGPRVL